MNEKQARKYLRDHRIELERTFAAQFPHLSVGGFYNPRVVSVSGEDIEFFCHYDNYDNAQDGWAWFYDTDTQRFYN